ncbi:MAG: hypothetical protein J6N21_18515 [Butyrivibrio sp.]|nr:hypothetical protein [Butyrivibrio sp.]
MDNNAYDYETKNQSLYCVDMELWFTDVYITLCRDAAIFDIQNLLEYTYEFMYSGLLYTTGKDWMFEEF